MLDERRRNMIMSGNIGETGKFHIAAYDSIPEHDIVFWQGALIRKNGELALMETWDETHATTTYGKRYAYDTYEGTNYFRWRNSDGLNYGTVTVGDYRLPTRNEFVRLYSTARSGSTYNGVSGARYAAVQTDVTYSYTYFSSTKDVIMTGFIFFPDGANITGKSLTINPVSYTDKLTDTITSSELNSLLKQGVLFLPALGSGDYGGSSWYNIGYEGNYYSATNHDPDNTYYLEFTASYGSKTDITVTDFTYDTAPMAAIMCRTV